MMAKKLSEICLISGLVLILSAAPTTAQDFSSESIFDAFGSSIGTFITTGGVEGAVVGTPYISATPLMTTVILRTDEQFEDVMGMYNAYSDKLEIFQDDKRLELNELRVSAFEMLMQDGSVAYFRNRLGVNEGHFDNLNYLRVLHEGDKLGVYKRYKVELQEGRARQSAYDNTPTDPMLILTERVYFKDQNGDFSEVNLRRRSVLRTFGDHSSKVREYVNSENLDYRNERDFAKMVAYYESLL